ncbi:hypothetical protein ACN47E_008251 [Coniothyrium glycines]
MHAIALIVILLGAVSSATSVLEPRQNSTTGVLNSIQIDKFTLQRNDSKIAGLSFDAKTNTMTEAFHCTTRADKSGEEFAMGKIHRCSSGAPLTFDYNEDEGPTLELWYTNDAGSYTGSSFINASSVIKIDLKASSGGN